MIMNEHRFDLRNSNQIRPFSCETSLINDSTGSSRFSQGLTEVIALVHGPGIPKLLKNERFDKATIELFLSMYGKDESNSSLIKSNKLLLLHWLEEAIDLEKYPRTLISIRLEVTRDDGALLSTMYNAAIIALLDAGILLYSTPLSITICKTTKNNLFIDPTIQEEDESNAIIIHTVKNGSNDEENIIGSQVIGEISIEELKFSIELANKSTIILRDFVRDLFKST